MDQSHEPSAAHDPESAMVRAWLDGDEGGFESLVKRYAPLIYNRCRRAIGAGDADDAAQAVFLVLARRRDQATASPALVAWLLRVADNVIRNAKRDWARRRNAETMAADYNAVHETTMPDIGDHLHAAMAELPAAERQALELHIMAGHTLAETAEHLGAPLTSVHRRVGRGLERLRGILGRRGMTIGASALIVALHNEASAAVPPMVLSHLHDLKPADGNGGAISVRSARVERWSRPRMSTMSRYALLGGAALIGATAYFPLVSSEQVQLPPPAPVPSEPPATDVVNWTLFRIRNGVELAERLKASPEAVLLADALPSLASVRRGFVAVAFIPKSGGNPAEVSVTPYLNGWLEATSPTSLVLAGLRLHPVTAHMSHDTSQATVTPDGQDRWRIGYPHMPELRQFQTIHDARWEVQTWSEGAHGRYAPAIPSAQAQQHDEQADIEIANGVYVQDQGKASHMSLRMTDSGARLALHDVVMGVSPIDEAGKEGLDDHQEKPLPVPAAVDKSAFASIPADALAGMVMNTEVLSQPLRRLIDPRQKRFGAAFSVWAPMALFFESSMNCAMIDGKPESLSLTAVFESMKALCDGLEHSDGRVLAWVQAGQPVPTVTWSCAMPEPYAAAILAHLKGRLVLSSNLDWTMQPNADGSVSAGGTTIRWSAGNLILSTRSDGSAVVAGPGGFSEHADVRTALTKMGEERQSLRLIIRPQAVVAQLQEWGSLAWNPAQQALLNAYAQNLQAAHPYSYIAGNFRGTKVDVTSGGQIALAIAAVMSAGTLAQLMPQTLMPHSTN